MVDERDFQDDPDAKFKFLKYKEYIEHMEKLEEQKRLKEEQKKAE